MTAPIPPLRRSITVPWPADAAFRRFTAEIHSWWPMKSHSVGGAKTERVVLEGKVGGRIYEVDQGGAEHTWGTVNAWEPPARVAFTWHPGMPPETSQQIEVRFLAVPHGTKVGADPHRLGASWRAGVKGAQGLPDRVGVRAPPLRRPEIEPACLCAGRDDVRPARLSEARSKGAGLNAPRSAPHTDSPAPTRGSTAISKSSPTRRATRRVRPSRHPRSFDAGRPPG